MKFRKMVVGLSVIAAMPTVVSASDGTINFTGEIVSNTCTITTGGGSVNVALPTLSANTFAGIDSRAGQTAFSIDLEDCAPAGGSVAVRFTGTPAQIDPTRGVFLPDNTSTESGVAVVVYDSTDTLIKPGGNSSEFVPVDIGTGTASIQLTAWYQQYKDTVTPGSLAASGSIEIVYK
jgi:major type 1 subunit fimbrin (pilin)